jgi:molybdopterin biosynthesis enzyme MoaB
LAKKKADGLKEAKRRVSAQSIQQRAIESHGEESVRDEAREVVWFIEGVLYL